MEAQSLEDSGHTKILASLEAIDQEKEADIEVIHESGNQSGDRVLLEHNHDKQHESLDTELLTSLLM